MNEGIEYWRECIDTTDKLIIKYLNERFQYCKEIGKIKKENNIKFIRDEKREQEIIDNLSLQENDNGMVKTIWPVIMEFSRKLQKEIEE